MEFSLILLKKSIYKNERSEMLVHFIFHLTYFTVNYIKKCYLQGIYIFNNFIKFNYLILYMFEMAMAKSPYSDTHANVTYWY